MSGGHFEYAYFHVEQFCNSLEYEIKHNKKKNEYGDCTNYKPKTIRELKRILKWCEITAKLMEHTEWLYSGDDSEETFLENIKKVK